jgi:acetoin utilization protein AcuC
MNSEPFSLVYHEDSVKYDFGWGHPFRSDRFTSFMSLIEERGLLEDPRVSLIKPEAATERDLLLAHTREYVEGVRERAEAHEPLTRDTPLNPSIVEGALAIVGSSLRAAKLVAEGAVGVAEGVGGGLHHAGAGYGGGFCVFNDVAVCARALLERHGLDRVLVFDTDVHAGNGTMDVFYEEPRVLFISVHQDPRTLYPGTGFIDQVGGGPGEGSTVNVPLPSGADDGCMALVLEEVFLPLTREFRPQAIIRNGGSDPHFMDGLGSLNLSFQGLRHIGEVVAEAASKAGCGVVDLCCSGYNPSTVAQGWLALLSGVAGLEVPLVESTQPPVADGVVVGETRDVISEIQSKLAEYWSLG